MTLKTIPIGITLVDASGNPLVGQAVTASLVSASTHVAAFDTDAGVLVPSLVAGTTNSAGKVVLNLWPNARGSQSTAYLVQAPSSGGLLLSTYITVPDSTAGVEVEFSTLVNNPPYPSVDAAQAAIITAQLAATNASNSASSASTQASAASASASAASASATAADTSATNAASSASSASTQASAASASATAASGSAATASSAQAAAASSASAASTSATNAASSASASAASASAASASATAASGSAATASSAQTAAASSASAASTSAASAATASGAALWVSGTSYALGALVYSPVNQRSYRRKVAGAGTTDPSLDATNWAPVSLEIDTQRPVIRPSLKLDFANSATVDPRITFTRASSATYTASNGLLKTALSGVPRLDYDPVTLQPKGLLIEEQRTNLLTYSEQFDNAAWSTTGGVTVAPNNATDPAGGLTADTATFTGSSYRYQGYATAIAGLTFTFSIWVSSTSGKNTIGVRIANNEGTESQFVLVNLTSTPQRISVTKTFTAASTAVFGGLDNRTVIVGGAQTTGDVIVWGAQLEAGAFATSYIPSTNTFTSRASTATYYGSNGLIQTAATNVARYNYNPANLTVAPTLLLEAAATNLVTYSEDFTNAVWNKSNASVTANAAVSPDGTTNADKLVENTATSTHTVSVTLIAGSAVYTYSVYVKAAGRSVIRFRDSVNGVDGYFDLTTVSSPSGTAVNRTIVAVGGGWYRCSMTSSAAVTNPEFGVRLATAVGTENYTGDGVSGVFLYGSQVEAGSGATSYIPTVASQVTRAADLSSSAQTTRAADNAVMTGTNFSSWYNSTASTWATNFDGGRESTQVGYGRVIGAEITTAAAAVISTNGQTDALGTFDGTYSIQGTVAGAAYWTTGGKAAVAMDSAGTVLAGNGIIVASTAVAFNRSYTAIRLGSNYTNSTNMLNGHIRTITYWPRRLSNTELQAITT